METATPAPDGAAALQQAHALFLQHRDAEALPHARTATAGLPRRADAWTLLGILQQRLGQSRDAEAAYREAIRVKPDYADAWTNLGNLLRDRDDRRGTLHAFQQAMRCAPASPEPAYNLGVALEHFGLWDGALAAFQAAVECDPRHADAHWNCALALLRAGRFEEGYRAYEWRFQRGEPAPRICAQPIWDGGPLAGRTILVWAEQGFGDTLQFLRFVPEVTQRGGRVVLEVMDGLQGLASRLPGVSEVIVRGAELPGFDTHVALMSLPHVLRLDHVRPQAQAQVPLPAPAPAPALAPAPAPSSAPASAPVPVPVPVPVPAQAQARAQAHVTNPHPYPHLQPHARAHAHPRERVAAHSYPQLQPQPQPNPHPHAHAPYLQACKALAQQWHDRLATSDDAAIRELAVGLVWAANPASRNSAERSPGFAAVCSLLRVRGARFYSLQKGAGCAELANLADLALPPNFVDLHREIASFDDTAAIIANLDVVVTCDTAVAHLAGALGKPVLAMLPYAHDWRYGLDAHASTWYPSMRLIRQRTRGDWSDVVEQVARMLEEAVASSSSRARAAAHP